MPLLLVTPPSPCAPSWDTHCWMLISMLDVEHLPSWDTYCWVLNTRHMALRPWPCPHPQAEQPPPLPSEAFHRDRSLKQLCTPSHFNHKRMRPSLHHAAAQNSRACAYRWLHCNLHCS